jgi:AcrR family transcriptional regulator
MARAGLDTEAVVRAAAELVDREGLEALTLSALAAQLGVRPPSLYAHVRGLDDLRRRLSVLAAEELGDAIAPAAAGLARGDALRAVGRAYRSWVLAHPGRYAALGAAAPLQEPAVERVLELVLSVLRGYGLHGDAVIHAARSLRAALHGFTALEASGGFGIPLDPNASFEWMLAAFDRGLAEAERTVPAPNS